MPRLGDLRIAVRGGLYVIQEYQRGPGTHLGSPTEGPFGRPHWWDDIPHEVFTTLEEARRRMSELGLDTRNAG